MMLHLCVKSPVAMFYLAVWHLTHQTSHWMCSFFLSFLLLKCALSLSLLCKRMHDLWSTIFTSYWAEATEQWRQKRERGRKNKIEKHTLRVHERDGVSRNMFSVSRCVPEGLELLLLWPRSCKRDSAVVTSHLTLNRPALFHLQTLRLNTWGTSSQVKSPLFI